MTQAMWRTAGGRDLVAEIRPGVRLVVTRPTGMSGVRFVVERGVDGMGGTTPMRSGYRESVIAAMEAAEEVAARLDA